jgi:hypothetical protein
MQTRSQTKIQTQILKKNVLYEVNIDFDEASNAWKMNKKYVGNGTYKYVCPIIKKDGIQCGKSCYKSIDYCWSHRKHATNITL